MPKLMFDVSMSLDGFITGPDPGPHEWLGAGGEQLHQWIFGLASWRKRHGMEGGEDSVDSQLVEEGVANSGAVVMGRRMFGGPPDRGPWGEDPGDGPWDDDPPFGVPVFILTHHPREPVSKSGGTTYTFVTDGIESALDQAMAAAGGKDVTLSGGADVARQYLEAGLLDEMRIHVVPIVLGGGVRLFEGIDPGRVRLEIDRVVASPAVTHLCYRPVN